MADYQFPDQNQWSEKPAIGTGEGESPLMQAPQNEITMRTMASDVASMKEMGGGDPTPYTPNTTQVAQTPNIQNPPQPTSAPTAPNPANTANTVVPPVQTAEIPVVPLPPKKSSGIFMTLVVIVIVLGLGAIGYFYVYPQFLAGSTPSEEVATETQNTPEQKQNTEEQKAPVLTTTTETTEASPTSSLPTSTLEVPPSTGLGNHVSLFKAPADFSSEVTLTSETVDAIKSAWKGTTVEVPILKEIVLRNTDGKILGQSKLVSLLLPSFITTSSSQLFEEDFTLFTYIDQKGVWPGIILRAKKDTLEQAKKESKKLESNSEWRSLFMEDPGKEQTWKDGKVGSTPARYIPFSTKGNALSYTWFDTTLLISTNYQGAQEAAKKLGF